MLAFVRKYCELYDNSQKTVSSDIFLSPWECPSNGSWAMRGGERKWLVGGRLIMSLPTRNVNRGEGMLLWEDVIHNVGAQTTILTWPFRHRQQLRHHHLWQMTIAASIQSIRNNLDELCQTDDGMMNIMITGGFMFPSSDNPDVIKMPSCLISVAPDAVIAGCCCHTVTERRGRKLN